MLEKVIRSPLVLIVTLLFMVIMLWSIYYGNLSNVTEQTLVVIFLIWSVTFIILIGLHNHRSPERKISWKSWTPYELQEEDEGQQWVTYRATRKVYIFFYFAIPAGLLVVAVFRHIEFMPLIVLFVLGTTQYGIYWYESRKYLNDREEV
ncbi:hypothetical protein JSY36_17125 [Bacillus sp. H-16]|uniref:hypothetical protein n=1 Tax=Alteribacter salitolerans TaxID=2912333 RepID=UPI001965484F|nr:hypothetical protein [Alteribacter salitolerans]MBM7097459.1 hypothetical protein [Alteribacter salitolerans]